MIPYLCTVRGCRLPLAREGSALLCERRHSFDVARSGYCNLLQPQDSRSRTPGDAADAVAARRRILDAGHERAIVDAVVRTVASLAPLRSVLDVGCGEGHYLAAIAAAITTEAYGSDLSVAAIELAAKRHRAISWSVANADRFLPFPDDSFDVVTSITSRQNAPEFRRVLTPQGSLIIVTPASDDLAELRGSILGEAREDDRAADIVARFADDFVLVSRENVRSTVSLAPDALRDLLVATYRAGRRSREEQIAALTESSVTFSRELLLFRRARQGRAERVRSPQPDA